MKRPATFFDWRAFAAFLGLSGIFGYLIHRVSGLEIRWALTLAAVGVLTAGLMATFGDDS
jgi:hypothetical protein